MRLEIQTQVHQGKGGGTHAMVYDRDIAGGVDEFCQIAWFASLADAQLFVTAKQASASSATVHPRTTCKCWQEDGALSESCREYADCYASTVGEKS